MCAREPVCLYLLYVFLYFCPILYLSQYQFALKATVSQMESVCAECRWCYLVLLSDKNSNPPQPISLTLLLFLCIITLYHFSWNSTWNQNTYCIGSWPIHFKAVFVCKCPFCSLHNYHSERMPYTPKWAKHTQKHKTISFLLIALWLLEKS